MYVLIRFKCKATYKKISGVPSTWIFTDKNGKMWCWWPLYGLTFKLKNMVAPPLRIDVDECKKWTEIECEIMLSGKTYRTYEDADKAISLLFPANEFESDFESALPLGESTRCHNEADPVEEKELETSESNTDHLDIGDNMSRIDIDDNMNRIVINDDHVDGHSEIQELLTAADCHAAQESESASHSSYEETTNEPTETHEVQTVDIGVNTSYKEITDYHTEMVTVRTAETATNTSRRENKDAHTEMVHVRTVEHQNYVETVDIATSMFGETDNSKECACGGATGGGATGGGATGGGATGGGATGGGATGGGATGGGATGGGATGEGATGGGATGGGATGGGATGGGATGGGDENVDVDTLLQIDDVNPYFRLQNYLRTEAHREALVKIYVAIYATDVDSFVDRMIEVTMEESFRTKIAFRNWPKKVNINNTPLLVCWKEAIKRKSDLEDDSAAEAIFKHFKRYRNKRCKAITAKTKK